MSLTLMYITNDPDIALIAEKNGVDRVWIDLETLGKEERQKGLNTVKSKHTIEDIRRISPLLTKSTMLVRINPINPDSKNEIEAVLDAGAQMIMLPMWKSLEDVKKFLEIVDGRCKTTLLLETKEAAECIDEVLGAGGFDEMHIGLNDLHLSLGLNFMFELLENGMVESLCGKMCKAGIPYGFGGIAQLGAGDIPAEKVILEHYRLGSTRAILSRSFCNTEKIKVISEIETVFRENMAKLREYESNIDINDMERFEKNRNEINEDIRKVAQGVNSYKYSKN